MVSMWTADIYVTNFVRFTALVAIYVSKCDENALLCWFVVSCFQSVVVWKGQFIEPGKLVEFYFAKFVRTLSELLSFVGNVVVRA